MHHVKKTLIASFFVLCSAAAFGESTWYQVEMIVFAHHDETAELEENWPEDVVLNYPSRLKMLFDSVSLPSRVNDAFTNLVGDDTAPNLMDLINDQAGNQEPEIRLDFSPSTLQNTQLDALNNSEAVTNDDAIVTRPLPFQRLGEEAKTLHEAYQHLRRIDRYRPLFHEVWQQPLQSRSRSPAILITGGEPYGSHFELEGTIKLSVERYLHIETDLWLHRFEPNFGQPTTLQVPDLPIRTTGDVANADSYSPFSFIIDEPYKVARTVTLRQSRRMRSGEIHYLDHPLFGVIVLVTPLVQD